MLTPIAKKQLTDMDKGNYSLCLAKVVNTDSVTDQGPIPVSNVIAASYSPGGTSDQFSHIHVSDK